MDQPFDFRGMRCFASGEPGTWRFLPRRPDVQRGEDGRPLLSLIDLGPEAYLTFTATWSASTADLKALREEIAARRAPSGAQVTLAYAPLASPRCDVLAGDGAGSLNAIASSPTSGFPPYDAVFNVHLAGERLTQARRALHGEQGFLAIEYSAKLRMPVKASALMTAPGARLAAWLEAQGVDDRVSLRDALERAIDTGLARVVIEAPDSGADVLASELFDRVLDRAADLLLPLLRQPPSSEVQVSVALERETGQPTSAFADLGALIPAETTLSPLGGHDAAD
jgi:hypothetical protein